MVRAIVVAIVIAACPVSSADAQAKQCSREEAIQAEATASLLATWSDILGSFRKFGHCDDGAIAEGY